MYEDRIVSGQGFVPGTFPRASSTREAARHARARELVVPDATHISIDRMRQRTQVAERVAEFPPRICRSQTEKQSSQLTILQQQEMSTCFTIAWPSCRMRTSRYCYSATPKGAQLKKLPIFFRTQLTTVKMRLHRAFGGIFPMSARRERTFLGRAGQRSVGTSPLAARDCPRRRAAVGVFELMTLSPLNGAGLGVAVFPTRC